MTFKRTNKDGRWLIDLTVEPEGTWYSADRGIYLIPDILLDAIESGFKSDYRVIIDLHEDRPEIFTSEYQDVRDVMFLDGFIDDEYNRFEEWINDPDVVILEPGYVIGMHPDYGDFGKWFVGIDIYTDLTQSESGIVNDLYNDEKLDIDENGKILDIKTKDFMTYDRIMYLIEHYNDIDANNEE